MGLVGARLTVVALIASFSLVSSALAGDCSEPAAPKFPTFDASKLDNMETADQRMQVYVDKTEEYLECLSEEERKQKMEGVLARMKQVTARYNELAVAYRKSKAEQLFSNSP